VLQETLLLEGVPNETLEVKTCKTSSSDMHTIDNMLMYVNKMTLLFYSTHQDR
jgi:hypothetical protein